MEAGRGGRHIPTARTARTQRQSAVGWVVKRGDLPLMEPFATEPGRYFAKRK